MLVLLLEDQALVRAGLRELIRISCGNIEVVEASCVSEAISFFSEYKFDFAFVDINLKDRFNGIDFLRIVRNLDIDVKLVMLSAVLEKDVILECINEGAIGFISKDFDSELIFSEIFENIFSGGIFVPLKYINSEFEVSKEIPKCSNISLETLGIRGRTQEVLNFLCQGYSNKIIARKMDLSEGTIRKDYVPKLFRIFKVSKRTELLVVVSRLGIKFPI